MVQGVIQRIVPEEGFGFIRDSAQEYFFHRTGLNDVAFEELAPGSRVDFSVSVSPRATSPASTPGQ